MRKLFFISVLLIPSLAWPICATQVGVTSIGAGSSSVNSGFTVANGVTLVKSGTTDTFNIYPKTAGVSLTGYVYTDNGGQPGTILARTASTNIPTANTWYTMPFISTANLGASNYWIAFQINSDVAGPAKDSVSWDRKYIASTYGVEPLSGSTWIADGAAKDSMYLTVCDGSPTPVPTLLSTLPFRRHQRIPNNNPVVKTGILGVGDSYTAGTGASVQAYCFFNRSVSIFSGGGWFPGIISTNQGTSGVDSATLASAITTTVSSNYGNEPKTRFILECGINNLLHDVFQVAYSAGAENSFKADLNKMLACWYFYYPNTKAVLFTVNDLSYAGGVTNGGLGANGMDPAQWPTYTQWVAAFNAGVTVEANLFPGTKVVDMYTILYGHPEFYNASAIYHPNDTGHLMLSQAVESAFYRGGNW